VQILVPKWIVIHHSLTPDGSTLSWDNIHSYHTNVKGWSDIGYQAGIEQVDEGFVCMFGRPDVLAGAHTRGYNSRSFGFCFVGNFDLRAPGRPRLREAARRVLAPWCHRYSLTVDQIKPHYEFASHKTCPGKMFDMQLLKTIVQEEIDAI